MEFPSGFNFRIFKIPLAIIKCCVKLSGTIIAFIIQTAFCYTDILHKNISGKNMFYFNTSSEKILPVMVMNTIFLKTLKNNQQ